MSRNSFVEADFIVNKLLELACDGIVVIEAVGIITLIRKAYTDLLGIRTVEAIGCCAGRGCMACARETSGTARGNTIVSP
ncbi:MAG: hypothetical protein WCT05_01290 [Lentisphaeria bacterium]